MLTECQKQKRLLFIHNFIITRSDRLSVCLLASPLNSHNGFKNSLLSYVCVRQSIVSPLLNLTIVSSVYKYPVHVESPNFIRFQSNTDDVTSNLKTFQSASSLVLSQTICFKFSGIGPPDTTLGSHDLLTVNTAGGISVSWFESRPSSDPRKQNVSSDFWPFLIFVEISRPLKRLFERLQFHAFCVLFSPHLNVCKPSCLMSMFWFWPSGFANFPRSHQLVPSSSFLPPLLNPISISSHSDHQRSFICALHPRLSLRITLRVLVFQPVSPSPRPALTSSANACKKF